MRPCGLCRPASVVAPTRASPSRPKAGPAESARRRVRETPARPIASSAAATDRCRRAVLIFVFAGVSYGRERPILAEFAPVPNAPSDVDSSQRRRRQPAQPSQLPSARGTCRNRRSAGAGTHALRRLGKKWPLRRFLRFDDEPATAVPASRRVQVHVHDVAVDPASHHRLRGGGGVPAVRLVADGAGHRAPTAYARAMQCLGSPFAKLLLVGFTFSFVYHFCNGIRHLVWDTGRGLERAQARRSGARGHRRGAVAHGARRLAGLPRAWASRSGDAMSLRTPLGEGARPRFGRRGRRPLVDAAGHRGGAAAAHRLVRHLAAAVSRCSPTTRCAAG